MIEIKDLDIGYEKNNPILSNLNYKFGNKIYGILGESGVGKSTFLRTVAGLNQPLSGEIINSEKHQIYMMHQNYTCFEWLNAIDNILIASKVKGIKKSEEVVRAAYEALEEVGLAEHADKLPSEMSGGMRQRLALARTLFVNPKVILMDEPLSALDEETRREMQDLILNEHRKNNNTILLITHSSEEAERMCDEIITLKGEEK